jgi:hypothetical protein
MPDPNAPVPPVAKAPVAPAASPSATAPNTIAVDERFAQLAAQLMAQVNSQIDALRQEFATQFGTNVDPLHKDLHDLLDMQTLAGGRIEKLEAANFVTPEDMQKQLEGVGEAITEKLAPKIQPVIQPAINVVDPTLADRITKIESRLKFF